MNKNKRNRRDLNLIRQKEELKEIRAKIKKNQIKYTTMKKEAPKFSQQTNFYLF